MPVMCMYGIPGVTDFYDTPAADNLLARLVLTSSHGRKDRVGPVCGAGLSLRKHMPIAAPLNAPSQAIARSRVLAFAALADSR
jgi:hypothetical protein